MCVLPEEEGNGNPRSIVALMPVIEVEASEGALVDDRGGLRTVETNVAMPDEPVYVGGYTVGEQPTFWFYVPYVAENALTQSSPQPKIDRNLAPINPNNIRVGKFVLLDKGRNFVASYLIALELLQSPRLVTFEVPISLDVDRLYNWHFSIICEPEKPSRNPVVRGWVQRVEPSPELEVALQNARPFETYLAYAEDDIWFEALSELIATRQKFPTLPQAQELWYDFLASFNIQNPESIDLSVTESTEVKADPLRQSQLPARI